MEKKLIVFDFDGVVCDSTNECMLTSYNAWLKFNNLNNYCHNLEEFSKVYKNNFQFLRPYVKSAGEYYVLHKILTEQRQINVNHQTYEELCEKYKYNFFDFGKIFYKERDKMKEMNFKYWISLHEIYNNVLECMRKFYAESRLYIVTLKDGKSVMNILEAYNLKIDNQFLIDKSIIYKKIDALNMIVKNNYAEKKSMVFLDDNINHLIEPKKNGYDVFLTFWSNPLEEFKSMADFHKIPLLYNINDRNF